MRGVTAAIGILSKKVLNAGTERFTETLKGLECWLLGDLEVQQHREAAVDELSCL